VFEVPCWNGEAVRVAFGLDTCDREAITWTATTSGIAGEQVRDLMVEAVERRFGSVTHAPHAIEWLTDNGRAYTAHDTVAHADALGSCPASRRCTVLNPTAWPKASSKVLSAIMCFSIGGRMR
jgi:putative transposase